MAAQDLPVLPAGAVDPLAKQPIERIQQELRRFMGFSADPLDMAVTYRAMLNAKMIKMPDVGRLRPGSGVPPTVIPGTSGTAGPAGPIGPVGPAGAGAPVPDLTAPPSVTGLVATGSFAHVIVEWSPALYVVGHGPATTRIYAAKRLPADPPAVFANAVLFHEATHPLAIAALPSELGIRWHIWAKFRTVDGVESVSPAGGTNGVQVTTGLVGNSNLAPLIVEAGNMADDSVLRRMIGAAAVGSDEMADSSVSVGKLLVTGRGAALNADPAFQDTSGWVLFAGTAGSFVTIADGSAGNTTLRSGAPAALGSWYNGRDRIPVDLLKTYRVRGLARRNGTANGVLYLGVALFDAAGVNIAGDGTQWFYPAAAVTPSTVFAPYSGQFGFGTLKPFPSNAKTMVPLVILNFNSTAGYMEAQDLRIEQKASADLIVDGNILAQHLSAGSIAVGSAAIEDGAIRNALIANLAVDNAKIVNMSVAKLTAGSIAVGEYIQSTGFVPGVSGWRILGNGAAEFASASIRGLLTTAQIQVGAASQHVRTDDAGSTLYSGAAVSSYSNAVIDGTAFTTNSSSSRVVASITGRVTVGVNTASPRFARPAFVLQLIRVSDSVVMDESGIFGADTRLIESSSTVTALTCAGALSFDAVAVGTYKVRLKVSMVVTDAAGVAATSMTVSGFNGEISAIENKL